MNSFLLAARQGISQTENGALALASTGSYLADQFGSASTFRGRELPKVFADQARLAGEDALAALRFVYYNRLVTRKVTLPGSATEGPGRELGTDKQTEKVQKGQGQRDETFKRLLWYAKFEPQTFYKNLWLLPLVGSFRDLWDLLVLARQAAVEVNEEAVFDVYTQLGAYSDLAKKYLPSIVASKVAVTERAKHRNALAKAYARFLGLTFAQYRKVKASGRAHEWQQLISRKQLDKLNYGRIPGKALFLLTKGKFLPNQHLTETYQAWLETQPVAKFTGYVYELLQAATQAGFNPPPYQAMTLNKQFDGLIELAKQGGAGGIQGNVWCALDTSGSMGVAVNGKGLSAYDVCLSLGLYFSTLNTGAFHKSVIMFDSKSYVKQLSGTFLQMAQQIRGEQTAWGGTNFQSVVDEIVRIRQASPGIPLAEFPQTLLVVSDMQFNPAGGSNLTNYQLAIHKLRHVFPDEFVQGFRFIWWQVTGRPGAQGNVPSGINDGGTFVFSGFDGSVITLLLGGEEVVVNGEVKANPSMEDMIQAALGQEILTYAQL